MLSLLKVILDLPDHSYEFKKTTEYNPKNISKSSRRLNPNKWILVNKLENIYYKYPINRLIK